MASLGIGGLLSGFRHLYRNISCNILQTLQKKRVEGSAFSGKDHLHCILMGKGFLVYTLACQCVIYVRYRNYLGGNGDLFALQSIWIAFST